MAEEQTTARRASRAVGIIQDLEPGTKLRLVGEATAEVVSNPKDGYWILARYLSSPEDPSKEGIEDLVFVTDILEELPSA